MPRRKRNARKVPGGKYILDRPKVVILPKIVILPVCRSLDDGTSPGRLRAVAEWRG
jgi:hypothetical protein